MLVAYARSNLIQRTALGFARSHLAVIRPYSTFLSSFSPFSEADVSRLRIDAIYRYILHLYIYIYLYVLHFSFQSYAYSILIFSKFFKADIRHFKF